MHLTKPNIIKYKITKHKNTQLNFTKKKTNLVAVPLMCVSAPNAAPGMAAPTAKTLFGKTQAKTKSLIHGHAGTSSRGQMYGTPQYIARSSWPCFPDGWIRRETSLRCLR
jgi:hypothetical protein